MHFTKTLLLALVLAIGAGAPALASSQTSKSFTIDDLRALAEKGDPKAQFRMALAYQKGRGLAPNMEEAVRWYRLAAAKGHAASQNNLGLILAEGLGVRRDPVEAVRLIKLAIENGIYGGEPETTLGWWYQTGKMIPALKKDLEMAKHWNEKGAEKGNPNAGSNLALMYFMGAGVPQDYTKMVCHLVDSARKFTWRYDWVLEKADEWIEYQHMAPERFMEARRLYWNAITTKRDGDLDALEALVGKGMCFSGVI